MQPSADLSLAAEISTLARALAVDKSSDTALMLLKVFPQKDDLNAAFAAVDERLNGLLQGLLAADDQSKYPEVLACVFFLMYSVDKMGDQATPQIGQQFAKSFFFFLEFMVDTRALCCQRSNCWTR
jgi:hypothetical protein